MKIGFSIFSDQGGLLLLGPDGQLHFSWRTARQDSCLISVAIVLTKNYLKN